MRRSALQHLRLTLSTSSSPSAFLRPRPSSRPFSLSARALAPESKEKAKEKEPEPDTTVAGRSPFAAFVDAIRDEVRKNREWQDSVKQLGGEVDKVQDSEAMKKAKETYERARVSARGGNGGKELRSWC